MKEARGNYGESEFIHGTRLSGAVLEQFVYTNMPPEAERAIDDRIVTPTVNELLRLAGISIDDLPDLAIEELIGPTSLSELDRACQAFYFSGPKHPILVQARRLPSFLTYEDMIRAHARLGVRQQDATVNFMGLVRNLFEDDDINTFGDPGEYRFERTDGGNMHHLHRFAVRRGMALKAAAGEYIVGLSGTRGANIFNGTGRALVKSVFDSSEREQYLELTMLLESMEVLVAEGDDPKRFDWRKTYKNSEGMGYSIGGWSNSLYSYIAELLQKVGAINRKGWGWDRVNILEDTFVVAVNALCPLDKAHKSSLKRGDVCCQGVHSKGLTPSIVQRAKSVAACIREVVELGELDPTDPDLDNTKPKPEIPEHEW